MDNKELVCSIISNLVLEPANLEQLGGGEELGKLILQLLRTLDAYDRYKDPEVPKDEREKLVVHYPALI